VRAGRSKFKPIRIQDLTLQDCRVWFTK